ncbi:hypothetical protein [Clostridium novyi]|uniref:hypothetical protein n=1 Tax=Clostridium novyi TaxID=1542 RepID=UPI0002D2B632|nr:hypothetical protein [Clostridium novyi]KEH88453.1 hypothetical protein Z966_04140 [Clostridium novyi A str. NCTC 538]
MNNINDNNSKHNEFLISELKYIIDEKNTTCAYYENQFKIISNNYKKFQASKEKLYDAIKILKKNLMYYEKKVTTLKNMNFNKRRKITLLKENIKSQDKRILSLIEDIKFLQNEVNSLNTKLNETKEK